MIVTQDAGKLTINSLQKASGNNVDKIKLALVYNIITPRQMAFITGATVWAIEGGIREGKLTVVYPFPSDNMGPKFIVRDQKFNDYIANLILKSRK